MIFANTLCLLLGCRRYTVYSIYDIIYIGAICDILHGLHNVDSFISLLGFKTMEHTSLSVLIQTSWLPARKYFSWIFLKTIWSCLITSGYVWRSHGNQWQLDKPCRVFSDSTRIRTVWMWPENYGDYTVPGCSTFHLLGPQPLRPTLTSPLLLLSQHLFTPMSHSQILPHSSHCQSPSAYSRQNLTLASWRWQDIHKCRMLIVTSRISFLYVIFYNRTIQYV